MRDAQLASGSTGRDSTRVKGSGGSGSPSGWGSGSSGAAVGTSAGSMGGGQGLGAGGGAGSSGNGELVMLWYLEEDGSLGMVPARTGITDGQMTEVISARLEPGMQIIAGVTEQANGGTANPFQNNERRFRPGGF